MANNTKGYGRGKAESEEKAPDLVVGNYYLNGMDYFDFPAGTLCKLVYVDSNTHFDWKVMSVCGKMYNSFDEGSYFHGKLIPANFAKTRLWKALNE